MLVTIICDRCSKEVEGLENEQGTSGFYRVDKSAWVAFAKDRHEKVICDGCMWADPEYQAIYIGIK
jgi:hypothetical protein